MNIISTSYSKTESFTNPAEWLQQISFYTGILEALATDHKVFGIERINYNGFFEKNNVRYYFIRLPGKSSRFPWRIHQLIQDLDADVVLVNGFIFPLQIMQLRAKLGKHAKIIVLHRAEKPFKGIKRILQRIAGRSVDAFLFTSYAVAAEWYTKNIIPKKKVREVIQASSIYKLKDKEAARKKLNIETSQMFLWVGRLDENKDPLTVIAGFTKFLETSPDSKLYMIYQEAKLLTKVKAAIAKDPLAVASIILVGKKSKNELEDWYNASDFFISGSHYEGSGIAAVEAMSCGCVPILTSIPSFMKLTGPYKTNTKERICGLLYEAGNPESLFNALLMTNLMDFERERKRTIDQFNKEFSFEAIAKKINEIITE